MKFKNYIETESGIKDTSTSPGTAGQILSSTVAGTSWIDQNTISSGTSETIDIQVKNIPSADGGINLVKGDPVYIYGSVGASPRLYVDLANADSTAVNNLGDNKMPCVALLDQDLAPNIEGTATVVGKLRNLITSPIDGNVPNENDTVYVKSGGGLTLIKPTGSTNLIQNVGQVGRVSTSADGNIVVAALLRSNDVPNLPTGRIWIGDGNTIVSDTVYVDEPNGRVGIGTSSPNSSLEVAGEIDSVGGDGYLVEGIPWARGNLGLLELGDWSGVGYDTSIFGANGNLAIRTQGGNVGIGTTNPGTYRLAVAGSTNIGGNVEVSDGLGGDKTLSIDATIGAFQIGDIDGIGDGAHIEGDSSNIKIFTGSSETLVCNSVGNVGIGTTIPSSILHLEDATPKLKILSNQYYNSSIIEMGNGARPTAGLITCSNNPGISALELLYDNGSTGDARIRVGQRYLDFQIDAVSGMYINSSKNVGIGTTSPNHKLEVTGNMLVGGGSSNYLYINNTANFLYGDAYGNTIIRSADNFRIQTKTGGGESVRVTSAGNVGIGTTVANVRLEIGGGSSLARVIPSVDNEGYIGDSQHRWQAIYATYGAIVTSDIREKTEIKPTKLGLDFINDLTPVSYKWIEGERLDASKDERNHHGLIAQEVAKTLEKHGVDKNKFGGLDIQKTDEYDDFHAMSYEQLIAPMIKAIQELKAEIEELKKQINK